jgi:hypothetical protein
MIERIKVIKMPFRFIKRKPVPTERLLSLREEAGENPEKHKRYHKTVNRYQKIILKAYDIRKNIPFFKRFLH